MFSKASVILFTGGDVWQWVCVWQGACMAGGVHDSGGCAWQETGQTATAADSTHPTGMHSCTLVNMKRYQHMVYRLSTLRLKAGVHANQ